MRARFHTTLFTMIPAFLVATAFLATPARAAIAIDASVSVDQNKAKSTVATPTFSTTSGNELLLAFLATDYLSGTTPRSAASVAAA